MNAPIDINRVQSKINAERIYKRVSNRMALQIWQGYTRKHLERPNGTELCSRLRLAHTLLLQLKEVYFSQHHNIPHIHAMQWLVLKVLNDRDSAQWRIVGQ